MNTQRIPFAPILPEAALLALGGPPGCGKGTLIDAVLRPYCAESQRPLFILPISAGITSLLDEHSPEDAAHIRRMMKDGYLVPDEIANQALLRAIAGVEKVPNGIYVIDGGARTVGQIEHALIHAPKLIGIPEGRRKFIRFTTEPFLCGFRACGRKRDDDTEESVVVRWHEFTTKTKRALDDIDRNKLDIGVEVKNVDGSHIRKTPDYFQSIIFGRNGS